MIRQIPMCMSNRRRQSPIHLFVRILISKEGTKMIFTFYPTVTLLVVNKSNEKEQMSYMHYSWPVSKIGLRPPFYAHPRYTPEYPVM